VAEPQKVTITGTLRRPGGAPDVGAVVKFERAYELRSGATPDMIGPGVDDTAVADAAGAVSLTVYANDDALWTPQGWPYKLTIGWSTGDKRYDVLVPYSSTPIDLDDLLPLVTPPAGSMYAPIGHTHEGGGGEGGDPAGTAAALVTAHEGAADPHSVYLTQPEGDARYALTAAPAAAAAAAVAAHVAAGDPHPQYLTAAEGAAAYEPAGTAAAAVAAHAGAANPHPVYLTEPEGDGRYALTGAPAAAVAAHVADANPHPVYLTAAEGAAAYDALGAGTAAAAAAVTAHEGDADPHPQYPTVLVWDGVSAYVAAPGAIVYVGGTVDPTGGAPDGSVWIKETAP
jgi:hypothetical protein